LALLVLSIFVIIIQRKSKSISTAALSSFLGRARRAVGLSGDVNVLITANQHMRRLNQRFCRNDKPTDVLSFPSCELNGSREKYAGDLAISLEIAKENAQRLGHSLQEEIQVLMLHGVLHLAGYDHECDDGEMARLEERLRSKLRLPTALISRSDFKTRNGVTRQGKRR